MMSLSGLPGKSIHSSLQSRNATSVVQVRHDKDVPGPTDSSTSCLSEAIVQAPKDVKRTWNDIVRLYRCLEASLPKQNPVVFAGDGRSLGRCRAGTAGAGNWKSLRMRRSKAMQASVSLSPSRERSVVQVEATGEWFVLVVGDGEQTTYKSLDTKLLAAALRKLNTRDWGFSRWTGSVDQAPSGIGSACPRRYDRHPVRSALHSKLLC